MQDMSRYVSKMTFAVGLIFVPDFITTYSTFHNYTDVLVSFLYKTNSHTVQHSSPYRYSAVHLLIAHCQTRREAHDEALSHWSELLSKVETTKDKANIYEHISECCIKLGKTTI